MNRIGMDEEKAVLEVLRRDPVCLSGYYRNPRGGPSVQAFEDALAEYHGVKNAVCCSNGTAALFLSLMAWGIKTGDEVITTPLTFSATATAILMCGAKPIFVDVDPETYNIDPEHVWAAITPKTKAVIAVHLLGMPCNMDRLKQVVQFRSERSYPELLLLEDNAQALGARYKGKVTGSFGQMSCVSFQETKTMTSGGEGGVVLTDDDLLAEKISKMRNHGQQYSDASYLCWNLRMTEIQAAFGLVQLKKIDAFNKMQVENAKILFKHLTREIHPPHIPGYAEPTLYIMGCMADKDFPREHFISKLTEKGINKNLPGATVGLGYTRTIMDLPLLQPYKTVCPVAEDLVKRFIWFDLRWRTRDGMENIAQEIENTAKEV